MQLRKVCNHPYLFSKEGYHINEDVIRTSGKVELLELFYGSLLLEESIYHSIKLKLAFSLKVTLED